MRQQDEETAPLLSWTTTVHNAISKPFYSYTTSPPFNSSDGSEGSSPTTSQQFVSFPPPTGSSNASPFFFPCHHGNETYDQGYIMSSPWLRKPLSKVVHETHHVVTPTEAFLAMPSKAESSPTTQRQLPRHLSLFDLLCVGVGSTIGSGIFVLCGLIARNYAGPATFVSWLIAGIAACLSGVCYAELAGKIPSAGSVYAYAYVSMGEYPAVIAAACLTLEYVGSASAVARSWGDKVLEYVIASYPHDEGDDADDGGRDHWIVRVLNPGMGVNPMAFLVSFLSMILLLRGVKESKHVTNFFTSVNVLLVVFMTMGGLMLMDRSNLTPLLADKPGMGIGGVFRGATSSFFGYIGFDEVCCIAGEAQNPKKNMPLAVMYTLVLVTVLYMTAAVALVGMQPYELISPTTGFPNAFRYNDVHWAAQLTAIGELFVLPSVVLITLMAQPRLQFALSQDGLLPRVFGEMTEQGNLYKGALIAGIIMTVIATFIPFTYLDDLISAGILVAFTMTNWCVVALRYESPPSKPFLLEKLLGMFNGLAFLCGICIGRGGYFGICSSCGCGVCMVGSAVYLRWNCPKSTIAADVIAAEDEADVSSTPLTRRSSESFSMDEGEDDYKQHMHRRPRHHPLEEDDNEDYFETPWVPFLPCLGMFLNWYLISQLEVLGLSLLLLYIGFASILYFSYGAKHSVGATRGWNT